MPYDLTHRQEMVLAALAAEGGASFAPVQLQKLFFVLDENISDEWGGRQFDFEPYDYGPFDKAVYQEFEALERLGLAQTVYDGPSAGARSYSLTLDGQQIGEKALSLLPGTTRDYITQLSSWVRALSFAELVGAIYRAYPDMRENSVFQE